MASDRADEFGHTRAAIAANGALSTIVYRSRAVQPLSGTELHWLTQIAQSRNRAESLTGVIVYDSEVFYQWLEGPRENLARVMESILHDPRHTDVEILDEHPALMRHFGGWAMKLATQDLRAAPWQLDAIEAPPAIIGDLHRHPAYAPALLMQLRAADSRAVHSISNDIPNPAAPALQDVIRTIVVPQLLARHSQAPVQHGPARALQLAHLLIGPDADAASALLAREHARDDAMGPLFARIVEPAARALGDLWREDACSEFDVSLGLARLQSAVRLLGDDTIPLVGFDEPPPSVLVVPEPGERHLLGAALDSDVLWNAGWAPHCEFPASDAALQSLLEDTWFDALDLSLSVAFRREHWLPRVAATIAKARLASRNPGIVIVVGGRAFNELKDSGASVGANASSPSALHVDELILREVMGH